MKNIKIIHLINADTTGGVEVGAKLGRIDCLKYMDYEIRYIYNIGDSWITKFIKLIKVTKILLRETKNKMAQLQIMKSKINDTNFGTCAKCTQIIPFGRLMIRPHSKFCVNCAQ